MSSLLQIAALALVSSLTLAGAPALGQSAVAANATPDAAPLTYDVVSVKPNNSGSRNVSVKENSGSYNATNTSILNLIADAFNVREGLVSGLPGWSATARFDVIGKFTDASPNGVERLTPEQRRAMLAAILSDRFGLKMHREAETVSVYDLVVSKGGAKLRKSEERKTDGRTETRPLPGDMTVQNADLVATAVPISHLVMFLADHLDRTVIDQTGLAGTYDLHLRWTPTNMQPDGNQNSESGQTSPDLFTALQEQLGLKLVAGRGTGVVLVVDQLQRPSAN